MARAEAIKKERMSRKKPDEKIFELTLQNVDLAQLQPLPVKTNSAATPAPFYEDEPDPDAEAAAAEALSDPTLEEARHILSDYVALMKKDSGISKVP